MSKTIAATFSDYDKAETAADMIKERGLKDSDISIMARHDDDMENNAQMHGRPVEYDDYSDSENTDSVNDNISDGVITGGVLGGVAGLLIGAGSLAIPGLGIIAAAGPITGLLSGTVAGGIIGGLIDLGIPENAGKKYESAIRDGKVFLSLKSEDKNVDSVSGILRECGADSVDVY